MIGNGSLNSAEGGEEKGEERREGFVQDRCGWQREPEQHGGREGKKEGKGGKDLFRRILIGNESLNSTEGGRAGRKGKEGSVQDRYGWQREPEQHAGREGRKEGKGGKDLFRISVVGNGSVKNTERRICSGQLWLATRA